MSTDVAGAARTIRGTQKCATFRESHVPWIGKIPAHWDVVLLRLVARIESGHTPSRNEAAYWVPDECVIPWFSLADVWQLRDGNRKFLGETTERISEIGMQNSAARMLPAGTVVLSRTASVGFAGIMPRPMATTQDFVNWVCGPRITPDYLMWLFRTMKPEFDRLMMGSTHQTIYMPDARQFRGPLPPPDEQRAIARYLDHETARIDALIEKKQRQIELLHEKRAALISHAVTKGLNPDAPMKDSGVDWLGEVPAHWTILRFRRVLRWIEQGWSPQCESRQADEGEWAVLKAGCANYGQFDEAQHKALPADVEPERKSEIRPGDLLMSRACGTPSLVGSVAIVEACRPRLLLCDKVFRLHPQRAAVDVPFLYLALNSRMARFQIEQAISGAEGLANNITQESIKGFVLALPPRPEQQSIASAVSTATSKIDAVLGKIRLSIDRLRKYRTALISAAVTGKIDVRQEVA